VSVHHSAVLDTPRTDHWDLSGACRNADPELFFAERGAAGRVQQVRDAKAVCGRCQVREICLAYAMSRPDLDGVLGGTTEKERHVMRSRAKRAAAVRPISELLADRIEAVRVVPRGPSRLDMEAFPTRPTPPAFTPWEQAEHRRVLEEALKGFDDAGREAS
jgi:WhiB family redox-sensing transcriptional regulator